MQNFIKFLSSTFVSTTILIYLRSDDYVETASFQYIQDPNLFQMLISEPSLKPYLQNNEKASF